MTDLILSIAGGITLLAMALTMVRFVVGKGFVNRVVALDVLTIMAVSVIVMLSWLLGRVLYVDVALVYGVLSFLGVVAIARYLEGGL
ncbi:MAG: monovalent cation/H+ antiporter complex subunit F [Spirochaetales bacterium]